jgi:hypothetical protein
LEDGTARHLDRMERARAPRQPCAGRQQRSLSDSAGCCNILLDLTNYLKTLSAVHLLLEFAHL